MDNQGKTSDRRKRGRINRDRIIEKFGGWAEQILKKENTENLEAGDPLESKAEGLEESDQDVG